MKVLISSLASALFCVLGDAAFAAGITNVVRNGGFIGNVAASDWTRSGNFYADSRFALSNSTPGYAYLSAFDGSPANGVWGVLSQTVTIPNYALESGFYFWYRITSSDPVPSADSLTVSLRSTSGALLKPCTILHNQDFNATYRVFETDVSAYAGQTVVIQFAATNDSLAATVFRIDDVQILCVIPDPDTIQPRITRFEPGSAQYRNGLKRLPILPRNT